MSDKESKKKIKRKSVNTSKNGKRASGVNRICKSAVAVSPMMSLTGFFLLGRVKSSLRRV